MDEAELERERIKNYEGRVWTSRPDWRRLARRLLGRSDDDW